MWSASWTVLFDGIHTWRDVKWKSLGKVLRLTPDPPFSTKNDYQSLLRLIWWAPLRHQKGEANAEKNKDRTWARCSLLSILLCKAFASTEGCSACTLATVMLCFCLTLNFECCSTQHSWLAFVLTNALRLVQYWWSSRDVQFSRFHPDNPHGRGDSTDPETIGLDPKEYFETSRLPNQNENQWMPHHGELISQYRHLGGQIQYSSSQPARYSHNFQTN